MWNLILVHLEIVLVSVQVRCTVCAKGTIGSESFWMPPMVLLGDEAQWKLDLARLEIVPILTQDGYMVWVKRTIGLEIVLDAPGGTPRLRGSCGISFRSVRR
jgi:hypothetical protein